MSKRKIGEGHAAAMFRLGLKELRNAATPSRESVADSEIGLYGSATQGEIADARGGPGAGPEQETLTLDQLKEYAELKKKEAERNKERGHDRDDHERDNGDHEM
jgi:hypothetical protein